MKKLDFQPIELKQALRLIGKASPRQSLANGLLSLFLAGFPLLKLYLIKLIINSITQAAQAPEQGATQVFLYIVAAAGVHIAASLTSAFSVLSKARHAHLVSDLVFEKLHKKASTLELEYYENHQYHDLLHRARSEAPYRPAKMIDNLFRIFQNAVALLLIVALFVMLHWAVPLILLAATLPGVVLRLKYSGIIFSWTRRRTPAERKAFYYHAVLTSEKVVKEIRIFNLSGYFSSRFGKIRNQIRNERFSILNKRFASEIFTEATSALAIFGAYAIVAHQTLAGRLSLGDLVLYFFAFQRGLEFMRQLLGGVAGLYEDSLFIAQLFAFLHLPHRLPPGLPGLPLAGEIHQGISFRNVSFRYPGKNKDALSGLSFFIPQGKKVAFVGENGAGKTSLIKLLCRFYDPTRGDIFVDSTNLKAFSPENWQQQISAIFQDYVRYFLPAGETIRLGNLEKKRQSEIICAAKQAGVHDLISGLPGGYDTVLGNYFEQGHELSAGEWQKVALARAFFRQAPLILLDEPTSSMDALAESRFFERLQTLAEDKTLILISHRFSFVSHVDLIFVLENGRLAEQGTHSELLAQNGKYAEMFRKQAKWFQ